MKKLLILLILILALVLRFYKLDLYPTLNADEAAIGYNAYSLIQTGKDEHGNSWPIHFQSFNDYKPGLYFYMVLPFVKLIGLNPWAVRIPNAFLGAATVYLIYLLVKELFNQKEWLMLDDKSSKNKKQEELKIDHQPLAIIASFMLAISPWHIQFSRGGWEVNVATFFITFGFLFFLKSIKNPKFINFAFCILNFTLALYTYHAARVVVPLLGVGLIIIYWNSIKKNLKYFLIAGLIGLFTLLPLFIDITKSNVLSRAAGVGLFADQGPLNRINEQRGEHADMTSLVAKVLHNKPVNYGLAFMENWSQHYWGEFLFISGDSIQRDKVPETGEMYLLDLIFLAAGLITIVRNSKKWRIVIWWLIVAPVAAALTFQAPHALRAQNMVIPLVIISSYGLISIVGWINKYLKKKYLLIVVYFSLTVLITWQFARYQHMYWIHMAKEYPFSSQYGLSELVSYIKENGDKYNKIIITDRYDQPYILLLFYLKYPPLKFQNEHALTPRDHYGFSTVRNFDKYYFQSINFDDIRPDNPNSLIVGTPDEIPKEANVVKDIYGTNGYLYFRVVAN